MLPEYLISLFLIFTLSVIVESLFVPRGRWMMWWSWKKFLVFFLPLMVLAYVWDLAAFVRGHWVYNDDVLLGVWVGGVPVEDWLFFFLVPNLVRIWLTLTESLVKNG